MIVGLIARREFTELWRDGRLLLAGGLMLLLLCTALAVGWQQQRSTDAERRAAQALDHDDWLKQEQRHPHDAAHHGGCPLRFAEIHDQSVEWQNDHICYAF